MDRRLGPREGEWIDRSRPVEFRFEGQTYGGYEGDVLASALWANDVRMTGRSFKYHRPRGIYSLANHDVNTMVEDGSRTNLRADVLPVAPGLDVRTVNTAGGVAADRMRITDRFSAFLPVGFYYKAFHTPRRLFPFYERRIRKMAGLGRINPDSEPIASPKDYAFCDLVVVGGGPSGLAAAASAAEQGATVILVDEHPRPGGTLNWQLPGEPADHARVRDLLEKVRSSPQVEMRCGTQVAGWYGDHWLALVDDKRLTKLRAKSMVVAAGAIEQPAVFQNNDLPGVMLGSAAQRLIHQYAVKPFDRCVVLAANSDGYRVALDLHEAGVAVAAIADLRCDGEPTELAGRCAEAGITLHLGHTVHEALPSRGKRGIAGAMIRPLGKDGEASLESGMTVDCDGVAVSVGWAPGAGILYQAGGRFTYGEHVEQFVPQDLPPGVFAAGRVNGVFDLADKLADGQRAGLAAAGYLG